MGATRTAPPNAMSTWSQVFDDDRVLEEARRKARRCVVVFALIAGALVSAAPLATLWEITDAASVAIFCGTLLALCAAVAMVTLAREYRRLWRIELSVRRFVGHDAAGRRRALPWASVARVDVLADGLVVTGRDEGGHNAQLTVSARMPAYTALAHRAVEYAEAHGRRICVDGTPLSDLDLVALFPTLCETVKRAPSRL